MDENVDQMEARSGPNFVLWRRGMVAAADPYGQLRELGEP
jgi:hypothetical protein